MSFDTMLELIYSYYTLATVAGGKPRVVVRFLAWTIVLQWAKLFVAHAATVTLPLYLLYDQNESISTRGKEGKDEIIQYIAAYFCISVYYLLDIFGRWYMKASNDLNVKWKI